MSKYRVSVLMTDQSSWFSLCDCDTPAGASEVVRILLSNCDDRPIVVRVEKIHGQS